MGNTFSRFLKNSLGSTGTIFALSAVPLLISAGTAVDFMRRNDARETLVAIVDAAVLAGAQALVEEPGNKTGAEAIARTHFEKAIASQNFDWNLNVGFKSLPGGLAMRGTGTATLNTTIMSLVGIKEMQLYPLAQSEGSEAIIGGGNPTSNLEVVLMLDMTGSMCADGAGPCTTGTKVSALKSAAADLVEKIVSDDQSQFSSRVAIVPFSTRIRVGPDGGGGAAMKQLTGMPATWSGYVEDCTSGSGGSNSGSESGGAWVCNNATVYPVTNFKIKPCVSDRHDFGPERFIYTDAKPTSDDWFNAHEGSRRPIAEGSSNITPSSNNGQSASDPMKEWNYDDIGQCFDVHENNEVMGLSSNKSALKAKIDSLVAYGSTAGNLATSFAWAMLSPSYGTLFGGEPASYDDVTATNSMGAPKVRKIAVLMTDGAYNTFRAWKDQDRKMISDAAVKMCEEMKLNGVEIYTVGYELDDLSAVDKTYAQDTLQACGSSVAHFYNSLNSSKIQEDFEKIASSVTGSGGVRLFK